MDSVFLTCSITHGTVHLLEDSFTSTINRGRKRETTGFCCKLLHLKMRSLLERERERESAVYIRFLTGFSAKRLYQVVAQGTFNKSGQADGGAPVMSTPILAPI